MQSKWMPTRKREREREREREQEKKRERAGEIEGEIEGEIVGEREEGERERGGDIFQLRLWSCHMMLDLDLDPEPGPRTGKTFGQA